MMKTCRKCKEDFPKTNEYFAYRNKELGYLHGVCKPCALQETYEHRKKNPGSRIEENRKYYEKNRERRLEETKEYGRNNRHVSRESWRRYQARKLNNGQEKYTEDQVLAKYGTDCHLCNTPVDLNAPRKSGIPGWEKGLQIDHFIPVSKGGPDTLENVRPSHGQCNIRKHAKVKNG